LKTNPDVWIKGCGTHLYAGQSGETLFDKLKKSGYKLKFVGAPTYRLVGDFKQMTEPT
jgi:hypothetical protein